MPRTYKRAFTLFELIITIALVSILLGAIWAVYDVGFRTVYTQMARTTVKGEVGRLFINLPKELYQATSLTAAQQANLVFTADMDNNGVDETIRYVWSGSAGQPLNKISNTTVSVVNSVDSLAFSYYDVNNNLLSFPVVASLVRLVAININVTENAESFQLRSRVRLRAL